jgi:DNA-directed RNA polymerase specialized sigma24 family protein
MLYRVAIQVCHTAMQSVPTHAIEALKAVPEPLSPQETQDAVVLREVAELPYAEVAEIVGHTAEEVRVTVHSIAAPLSVLLKNEA